MNSRTTTSLHAKDEQAKKLIHAFEKRVRRLADGPVPTEWLKWIINSVSSMNGVNSYAAILGIDRDKRSRGRPATTSKHNDVLRGSVKFWQRHLQREGKKATANAAIRRWIREGCPRWSDQRVAQEAAVIAKDYSRALLPEERRKKRAKGTDNRGRKLPADWLARMARGEHF